MSIARKNYEKGYPEVTGMLIRNLTYQLCNSKCVDKCYKMVSGNGVNSDKDCVKALG